MSDLSILNTCYLFVVGLWFLHFKLFFRDQSTNYKPQKKIPGGRGRADQRDAQPVHHSLDRDVYERSRRRVRGRFWPRAAECEGFDGGRDVARVKNPRIRSIVLGVL